MPCLTILTNLSRSNIPNDFADKIIPILGKVINKPLYTFLCVVTPDCLLSFGGESRSPGAVAHLESIGALGVEENKIITKELTDFVQKEIGVHPDRFFISYYDIKGYNIAKGGVTMA